MNRLLTKARKRALSCILTAALAAATAPAAPFGAVDNDDPPAVPSPNEFKYMEIFSAIREHRYPPLSRCIYIDRGTDYQSPFAAGKEYAIISFTIYASQDCSLRLHEYIGSNMAGPPSKDGEAFNFDPAPVPAGNLGGCIGDVFGLQMTDNVQPVFLRQVFSLYRRKRDQCTRFNHAIAGKGIS